jgi:hypothetical protein
MYISILISLYITNYERHAWGAWFLDIHFHDYQSLGTYVACAFSMMLWKNEARWHRGREGFPWNWSTFRAWWMLAFPNVCWTVDHLNKTESIHFGAEDLWYLIWWGMGFWLVVWNMNFICPFSWECHHPTDELIFFRGVGSTTNQYYIPIVFPWYPMIQGEVRWCSNNSTILKHP